MWLCNHSLLCNVYFTVLVVKLSGNVFFDPTSSRSQWFIPILIPDPRFSQVSFPSQSQWLFPFLPLPVPYQYGLFHHNGCCFTAPLSLEVVEKPNTSKNFWPPIFPEGQHQLFYNRLLARFTVHRLAKCGWVPFDDLLSAKPSSEIECRIYGGLVKTASSLKRNEPTVVVKALARFSIATF